MVDRYIKVVGNVAHCLPERKKDKATHVLKITNAQAKLAINKEYFVVEDGDPRVPTQEELDARAQAKIDAQIEYDKLKLKEAVTKYEAFWIDRGMKSELDLSRARFEDGAATVQDLPKAAEVGAWLQKVYGSEDDAPVASGENATYYAQKNMILDGEQPSYDFSQFDPQKWDFHDLAEERQNFLAGN